MYYKHYIMVPSDYAYASSHCRAEAVWLDTDLPSKTKDLSKDIALPCLRLAYVQGHILGTMKAAAMHWVMGGLIYYKRMIHL